MPNRAAVILIDHGSKNPQSHTLLEQLAEMVSRRLNLPVVTAHLTVAQPSLEMAVSALAAEQVTQIVIAPCFLFDGRHAGEDIPSLVTELREAYPQVSLRLAEPLGVDDLLADLVAKRVRPQL